MPRSLYLDDDLVDEFEQARFQATAQRETDNLLFTYQVEQDLLKLEALGAPGTSPSEPPVTQPQRPVAAMQVAEPVQAPVEPPAPAVTRLTTPQPAAMPQNEPPQPETPAYEPTPPEADDTADMTAEQALAAIRAMTETPSPSAAGGPRAVAMPTGSSKGMAYGPISHESPQAFLGSLAPYAQEVERETGIPAGILAAIPMNEQGWQKDAPGNNYYGIKGKNPDTGASFNSPTWEVVNGQRVNINDTFRAYDSPADSMRDFVRFLHDNSRYAPALKVLQETGDPAAFIRAVHAAGYATDPAWSDKILSIAKQVPSAPVTATPERSAVVPAAAPVPSSPGAAVANAAPGPVSAAMLSLNDEPVTRQALEETPPADSDTMLQQQTTRPSADSDAMLGQQATRPILPPPLPDVQQPIPTAPTPNDIWTEGAGLRPNEPTLPGAVAETVRRTGVGQGLPSVESALGLLGGEPPAPRTELEAQTRAAAQGVTGTVQGGITAALAPVERFMGIPEGTLGPQLYQVGQDVSNVLGPEVGMVRRVGPSARVLRQEIERLATERPAGWVEQAAQLADDLGRLLGDETATAARQVAREAASPPTAITTAPNVAQNVAQSADLTPPRTAVTRGLDALGRALPEDVPAIGLEARAVPEARRVYHGTAGAFDRPDPGRFDPNGLFGPGYYLTSDPRVAGSYAGERATASLTMDELAEARRELKYLQEDISKMARPLPSDWQRAVAQAEERVRAAEEAVTSSGPNIRAVGVPRGLRLLDADGLLGLEDARNVASDMPADVRRAFEMWLDEAALYSRGEGNTVTGDAVHNALVRAVQRVSNTPEEAGALANRYLSSAGYDGIKYAGGKRTPMADDVGRAIEHDAYVIFPESLDKITNAFSGTPGGMNLPPGVGSAARRAATGATAGAASEYYDPANYDENGNFVPPSAGSVLGRAALGAAAGLATSRGVRRAVGLGVIEARDLSHPTNRRMGQMFAKTPEPEKSSFSLAQLLARELTDDRALVYGAQKAAIARNLPGTVPTELVGDITRVNPDSVAAQRLQDAIVPLTDDLRKEGVGPSILGLFTAHMHNVDVANQAGQKVYDAAIARGISVADASRQAIAAASNRNFSGVNLKQTIAALQSIEQDLGPQKFAALTDAAERFWGFTRETFERELKAGRVSQDAFDELTQRYPHYVRTTIVPHMAPEGSIVGSGRSISDRGVPIRAISIGGTGKERFDPIASTVLDTLEAERGIAKNTAFRTFRELVQADPDFATQVLGVNGKSRMGGTREITGFEQGTRERLVLPKQLADVLDMSGGVSGLGWWSTYFNAVKSLITTHNPAFSLVVSPTRDALDFMTRQSAYEGGPQNLPKVLKAYADAIPDVFSGFLEGRYTGEATRRYRLAGGDYERLDTSPTGLKRIADALTDGGGIQVNSPAKLATLMRDLITLGSKPIGARLELLPRVAASELALKRGATPIEAMISGRNATIPYEVGGRAVRVLNNFVMFMNPSVQNAAQFGRMLRDHPVAGSAALATTVGVPALLSEFWNREDPERAAAYQDVPRYLKDNGHIFMMPWAGSDKRGPLPNFVWIPFGIGTPVAMAAHAAVERGAGDADPRAFGEMLTAMLTSFSPVKGESVGSALSSVVPPGISEGIELGLNKDFYRGSTIATDQSDERASTAGQLVAQGAQALGAAGRELPVIGGQVGGLENTRPSQVDFLLRNLGGIAGQIVRGGSDLAAGRQSEQDRPIQDMPVVGGLVGRIVRDQTGQQLQNARDAMVTPAVRDVLKDAGMRPEEVTPVRGEIQGIQLTRAQQTRYQERTNFYLGQEIARVRRSSDWQAKRGERESQVRDAISTARERAAKEVRLTPQQKAKAS